MAAAWLLRADALLLQERRAAQQAAELLQKAEEQKAAEERKRVEAEPKAQAERDARLQAAQVVDSKDDEQWDAAVEAGAGLQVPTVEMIEERVRRAFERERDADYWPASGRFG